MMFPSTATMYLSLMTDDNYFYNKVNYWNNVHGVNMSALCKKSWNDLCTGMIVSTVSPQCIQSKTNEEIIHIDCMTVTKEELSQGLIGSFELEFERITNWHGFIGWFDVKFNGNSTTVTLDTSPMSPPTHWEQMMILVGDVLKVNEKQLVTGTIKIQTLLPKAKRHIFVTLDYETQEQRYLKEYNY
eukprot:TRINITY_DN1781_c0_g1_i2.p1 TRINITY_DN1781_c0_g1~~TRINITY_DN1781_c0_g1_i2.p1  ORF type:complete len:186 (-),score=31.77 TRINITY_DN1781_c0_g1_i2:49-606(-)